MLRILYTLLSVLVWFSLSAQEYDYRSPVDFRILPSGTFAELRSNHFHSGLDIKTAQVIGKDVHAIADGYVSRINISPYGFGKALYITHPDGHTSVYAHLSSFNSEIQKYAVDQQYARTSFSVNIYPKKSDLPVKRGDVVALSGNSGGSMGPHLHFEIRDEATQEPLNPQLFGFEVKDFIRPIIQGLMIYPVGKDASVAASDENQIIELAGWGPNYRLKTEVEIPVFGDLAFGIQTVDKQNDSQNKNGIYEIALYIDDTLVFQQVMDRYAFSESRYINALIDYETYKSKKRRFQRTEIDPNNRLRIYKVHQNGGVFSFSDGLLHQVRYEVKDIAGNCSILNFELRSDSTLQKLKPIEHKNWLAWDESIDIEDELFSFSVPKNAFYRDIPFDFQVENSEDVALFSPIIHLNTETIPIHKHCRLKLKVVEDFAPEFKDKLAVVELDEDGEKTFIGGSYTAGNMEVKIRNFGRFSISIDTVSPSIKRLKYSDNQLLNSGDEITFKIEDKESGIDFYRGLLNGKWVLMDYDAKTNRLTYSVDNRVVFGENRLQLEVKDERGNRSEQSFMFNSNAE